MKWSFQNITNPQFSEAQIKVKEDVKLRKQYMEDGFTSLIMNYTQDLTELREKLLLGNSRVEDKIKKIEEKILELEERKNAVKQKTA